MQEVYRADGLDKENRTGAKTKTSAKTRGITKFTVGV